MRYSNVQAFKKHLSDSMPNHLQDLYLLLHPDPYQRNQLLHLFPCTAKFDCTVTPKELLGELLQLPFLDDHRVVILTEIDQIKKEVSEAIVSYLENPNKTTRLILVGEKLAKNTRLYKRSEKLGVVLQVTEPKPWEKEGVVKQECHLLFQEKGKRIAQDAVDLLVKRSGVNSAMIVQEVEKLVTYVDQRTLITKEDVLALTSQEPQESIWQLGTAIFSKNLPVALQFANGLHQQEPSIIAHLRPLRYQVEILLEIASYLNSGQADTLPTKFPQLRGGRLQKQIEMAKTLGVKALSRALLAVDETELLAKNSAIPQKLLFEGLIIKLCV